jgi:hypothetical protein
MNTSQCFAFCLTVFTGCVSLLQYLGMIGIKTGMYFILIRNFNSFYKEYFSFRYYVLFYSLKALSFHAAHFVSVLKYSLGNLSQ